MNAPTVVVMDDQSAPEITAARNRYAERITAAWHSSRESIIAIGQALIEAKSRLPHGQFIDMLEGDLPFSPRHARRLMEIASDPKITNGTHVSVLPESGRALSAVAELDDEQFEEGVNAGIIHPKATEPEIRALAKSPRPPLHVTPRLPEALQEPIQNAAQLLATLKGYRAIRGLSQLVTNDIAGMQEGYVNKLEIDIRRAVNESFWWWIGALELDVVLVPRVKAG